MEEIAILQPKLIVAVGNKAHKVLRKLKLTAQLEMITHYGYRYITEEMLEEDLKRVRKLADKLLLD